MRKLVLTMSMFFSLFVFSNNERISECEEVVSSTLEMIENEYGCMSTEEYTDTYNSMMEFCEEITK